ncbi:hypothetical protein HYPGJ_20104 [Hyphomicrobium sp. GJ21]|nr:hypothetical protein HYPGJ_20104 [Hyphomicrobium sp. GJ21]
MHFGITLDHLKIAGLDTGGGFGVPQDQMTQVPFPVWPCAQRALRQERAREFVCWCENGFLLPLTGPWAA